MVTAVSAALGAAAIPVPPAIAQGRRAVRRGPARDGAGERPEGEELRGVLTWRSRRLLGRHGGRLFRVP